MKLRCRLIFLAIYLASLIVIGFFVTGDFDFLIEDFWFAAGLFLLVLMSLIDQPFFSTDANIFMNGVAGLSLILVEPSTRGFWWHFFLVWCVWLIISSYIIMALTASKPDFLSSWRKFFSKVNREIGRPQALFSGFFIWGAIRQFGLNSAQVEPLFAFWVVFMILNIPSIARAIDKALDMFTNKQKGNDGIGCLYRVADPRVIEIKINMECPDQIVGKSIGLSTNGGENIAEAVVIDDRTIAGNRIAKVAVTAITQKWNYVAQQPDKMVFSITDGKPPIDEKAQKENTDIPISIVDVGSDIGTLKFFIHPDYPLRKGEIVWASAGNGEKIYYQITLANIIEKSSIDGNATRSVLVTANQLGVWQEAELRFEQYAWVPPAGYIIHHVKGKNHVNYDIPENRILIGRIPNSDFPVMANTNDLITHNTAILGITGSGKTYLAFHLIEAYLRSGIKILILDLTREYFTYLQKFDPTPLKRAAEIEGWFAGDSLLGIHQFAASNSYPETTRDFISAVFNQLKITELQVGRSMPARLCIVFEEAHSLIPEFHQVVRENDKNLVNETARIILQGRKYGLGSLIITQRTANVTKTILNQCNTIVALKSYDQTGLDFLKNYMGNEYSQAISTLPYRDGVMVGKSSSCQSPVIFSIPDFSDRWKDDNLMNETEAPVTEDNPSDDFEAETINL